jgi:hypothetical protein
MLTNDNIMSLSITDKVILSKYLENVKRGIQANLKNKNISGYGASIASGRSHDDFDIKETMNGAQLWGMDYLFELEYPLSPAEQKAKSYPAQWAAIRDWIDIKPIFFEGDISANTLAGLITRSIRTKGTKAWQKYGNNATGLVSDAITEKDIEELIADLGEQKLKEITEFLMHEF